MQTLLSFSNDLATAVERAARSIVAVHARPRRPSTGVHWRPGIIVTAEHTVRMEEEIRVTWSDGRASPASVVARDPATDLAILRIGDTDWPVAGLGDSASLKVGHLVLAVGYGPRASWGIVSAVGDAWRTWRGGEVDRFIRVDLVLYPGFSGGALVDATGHVAGLVTSGLSRQLELALPASTVERIVDELLTAGRISRGYLGLGLQPVALPESWRRTDSGGLSLIIVNVEPDGPAAQAGMMLGDVLVAIDRTPLRDPDTVQSVLQGRRAGTVVMASLIRAGTSMELAITLGERPSRSR